MRLRVCAPLPQLISTEWSRAHATTRADLCSERPGERPAPPRRIQSYSESGRLVSRLSPLRRAHCPLVSRCCCAALLSSPVAECAVAVALDSTPLHCTALVAAGARAIQVRTDTATGSGDRAQMHNSSSGPQPSALEPPSAPHRRRVFLYLCLCLRLCLRRVAHTLAQESSRQSNRIRAAECAAEP